MASGSSGHRAADESAVRIEVGQYNEAVQRYNTTIRTFPNAVGAKVFYGAEPMTPYQATLPGAENAPRVNFDALWDKALLPVLDSLGYQPVRADQDLGASIIRDMLSAEGDANLVEFAYSPKAYADVKNMDRRQNANGKYKHVLSAVGD